MPGLHTRDGLPTGFAEEVQTDGRKWIAHLTTGTLATVVSLLVASFLHTGSAGPQGPAGTETIITKAGQVGICAYFGPDKTGRTRFQIAAPSQDANGLWCKRGYLINLVPKKK